MMADNDQKASAGPSRSPKDNGVSELTIKNAKNTITNLFMLLSPL